MPLSDSDGLFPQISVSSVRSAPRHPLASEVEGGARHWPEQAPPPTAILDILKCPACVLDRTGNIVHLNSAWRERVGLVDVKARIAWTRLIHSEDMEVAYARFQSVATPGNLDGFECRLLDGNGNAHWFLLNLHPMDEGAAGKGAWLDLLRDFGERFRVYAASLSNGSGLMKLSAEWRRTGL